MTVDPNSIDVPTFMAEHLERAEPDLLRDDVVHIRAGVDVGGGRRDLRSAIWRTMTGTSELRDPEDVDCPARVWPAGRSSGLNQRALPTNAIARTRSRSTAR